MLKSKTIQIRKTIHKKMNNIPKVVENLIDAQANFDSDALN